MQTNYILSLADANATLETVGGKGASLARLVAHGLPVPDGFHVTTAAYRQFVAHNNLNPAIEAALATVSIDQPGTLDSASRLIHDLFTQATIPADVSGAIIQAYNRLPGDQPAVAVRSSATAEDLPDLSFAGQQDTFLNIHTPAAVLEAVRRCWASLWTARAIGYRQRNQVDHRAVSLAVVVQLLIPAEVAGILFTSNPLTGRNDQALINAAWGLGEAIVGGAVTPDTLVVEKASGALVERQTAEKQLMTVRVDGATQEQAVPAELRRAPTLDDQAASELVRLGVQIEQIFGLPMDIEWALADGAFAILQARPITALPAIQAPAPFEWVLPKPKSQYMRGSLADLTPNPVSPLFASMGIPAIADMGISRVMRVLTRSESNLPRDYITTINHYVYLCGSFTRQEWWWVLTHMLPSFPRLMRQGFTHWRDEVRPRYTQAAQDWKDKPVEEMTTEQLWREIKELVNSLGEYIASILVATTGASAGTEMLFRRVYEKMVQRAGDPEAAVFLLGFDSIPMRAEKSLFDLAEWARRQPELAAWIENNPASELAQLRAADAPPVGVPQETWTGWQSRFRQHLDRFGYIIYEVDFAKPLPLDDPTPMLQACKMYLRGEGGNPHERQENLETRRIQSTEAILQRARGLRRWAFRKSLELAQSRGEVREDAIADIGLGYPALRRALIELGRRLATAGAIEAAGDIFYLERTEIEAAVSALQHNSSLPSLVATVQARRASLEAAQRLTPPPMLPPAKKYLGFDMSHFVPLSEEDHTEEALKGIGASAGRVTAPACVMATPEDFDRMQPGNVIVAPITTPAWTPLFAMASAVVTDIGGPLSHGSIVAREYGIPAVMGTGIATKRIRDGQSITVDGSAGTVALLPDGS